MPKRIAANLKDDFTLQGLIDMGSKFHQNIHYIKQKNYSVREMYLLETF